MGYTPEQRRNIALAKQMTRRDPQRVRMALLEAMAVESRFRHLNYGDRDSQGVLQQRPGQGWGPYIPGVRGVRQDINDFLVRARRTNRGFRGTPGQLAQAVQRSAFPERYDQEESRAIDLLRSNIGGRGGSPGRVLAGRLEPSQGVAGPSAGTSPAVAYLLQASNELAGGRMPDSNALLGALVAQRQLSEQPSPQAQDLAGRVQGGYAGTAPAQGGGGVEELFYDPLGAIDNNTNIKPIGGHDDHVHFSARNVGQIKSAIAKAKQLGLRVSENPAVDPVDPVHTSGSFHYQKFKGTKYGRAIDVSGNPSRMAAFYRWVERNYRR